MASRRLISSMQIVRKYKIPYSTFTLYANLGFFGATSRRGNRRLFDEARIKGRIKKIKQLKQQGYPLRLIRQKFRG